MTSSKQSGIFVIGDKKNDPNRKVVGPERIAEAVKNVAQYKKEQPSTTAQQEALTPKRSV